MSPSIDSQMLQHALRAILLVLALVRPASAQARFDPRPNLAFALFRPAPTPPPARPASFIHSKAPDYRWEGLVIGAIAVGAFAAYFAFRMCNDPDSGGGGCFFRGVGVTLLGATAGGFLGLFAGLVTPKNHSASTP